VARAQPGEAQRAEARRLGDHGVGSRRGVHERECSLIPGAPAAEN
jgi:hypothetical protein